MDSEPTMNEDKLGTRRWEQFGAICTFINNICIWRCKYNQHVGMTEGERGLIWIKIALKLLWKYPFVHAYSTFFLSFEDATRWMNELTRKTSSNCWILPRTERDKVISETHAQSTGLVLSAKSRAPNRKKMRAPKILLAQIVTKWPVRLG